MKALKIKLSEKGLSTDPEWLHGGSNSGYQAINLALHLGATRIILLGFDMCNHSGKTHYFGDHPSGFVTGNPERFIKNYRTMHPERYGVEVLNCSRTTALDMFPRHDINDL